MIMEQDERQGKQSASKIERSALCPGSWKRTSWMDSPSGPDAEFGNIVHDALATGETIELTHEQTGRYDRCQEIWRGILGKYGPPEVLPEEVIQEKRLFASINGNIASCRFDVVAWYPEQATLILGDYKTGSRGAEDAIANLQLATTAVILAKHYPSATRIVVSIIQPLKSPDHTVAVYDKEGLLAARQEIGDILHEAEQPNAAINPGLKQCLYCPALGRCKEADSLIPMLQYKLDMTADIQKLAKFLDAGEIVAKMHKANRDTAKEIMLRGVEFPGWKIREDSGKSSIDVEKVFARLKKAGFSDDLLWAMASLTKTALQNALKMKTGKKGKELDQLIEHYTQEAVTVGAPVKKMIRI